MAFKLSYFLYSFPPSHTQPHLFEVVVMVMAGSVNHSWVIEEIKQSCRQLIFDNSRWVNTATAAWRPCPCIFGDLTHILPPDSFNPDGPFREKVRAIHRAPLRTSQHCFTHGKDCPIFGSHVDIDLDISGLPCPDHSPAGLRMHEQGKTSAVFACHAKLHCALQTPLLIIENVPDGVPCHSWSTVGEWKASGLLHCQICNLTWW